MREVTEMDRKMSTKALFSVVAPAILFAFVASAHADDIPACPSPKGVVRFNSVKAAPPALSRELDKRLGELVPPGGAFDATDVVMIGKGRRLIFIWKLDRRMIVATELGGIAYRDPILAYDLSADANRVNFVEERDAAPNTVCSTAKALLAVQSNRH